MFPVNLLLLQLREGNGEAARLAFGHWCLT
jgi:hypothetical protein